jgi:hypothetical protein
VKDTRKEELLVHHHVMHLQHTQPYDNNDLTKEKIICLIHNEQHHELHQVKCGERKARRQLIYARDNISNL